MKKIKLGVIYGGLSTEHEVSINSAKSVIDNLDKDKYDIYKIYIDKKGEWYKEDNKIDNVFDYLRSLDVVFPVLHGLYGEDGTIQGLFELLGVPYVGCGVLSSSLGMDKVYAKMIFDKVGIENAKYIYIKKVGDKYIYIDNKFNEKELSLQDIALLVESKLSLPVFIKPSRSGSSVGINKAHTKEEVIKYIEYASGFDNKILIEENIIGREIECAVLGNNEVEASPLGEILPKGEFYSYNAKYVDDSKTIIPDDIDKDISDKIRKTAIKAYKSLDCSGLSRVDFFLEKDTNRIILNEINTMPGFTTISMYPKLWESTGLSYSELLDKLISLALEYIFMKKIKVIIMIVTLVLVIGLIYLLYILNIIPHRKYSNSDFNINTYISSIDKDNDGIDDQTDILNSVREYIKTKPKYKSKYYSTGYPNDEYGVCSDVVAFGLKGAGYDLRELVNNDIINNKEDYDIETIDKNIDFRRVRNLKVYFERNGIKLTTDINDISSWQGGDIIIFKKHIGIVSDKRNSKGIPFIIHHANPYQLHYEEDILENRNDIIGHYRVS